MKNKKMKKITLLNISTSLFLQFITIISGFIIPKIILETFGSEVNGLVSSITQFLNYVTLIEGGIGGVVLANLYKPLYNNDVDMISSIINTANRFYRKIGFIFILYTIGLALIYPLIFESSFSYLYVSTLTLILSLSLFIQYMFSLTLRNLLTADKKVYIVSLIQIVITLLNILFTYLCVKICPSIHFLKLMLGIVFLIQPLILSIYVKKEYNLKRNAIYDNKLLESRWNGFAINLASFIHNSTDIAILTIFTNLSLVSVYSVFCLVSGGLKQVISSVATGINPTIGKSYASGDLNDLNMKFDMYEYIIFMLVFIFFGTAMFLINPFIQLYTAKISDAQYNQPLFGCLLLISEALYLIKFPHLNLAYAANKFKELTIPSFFEAMINIVISIILVWKYGLIGVTIGTIVAMIYRMIFHIKFTKRLIPSRKISTFYKKMIIFLITYLIGSIVILFFPITEITIISWILHGTVYMIIYTILYLIMSIIFYKKELMYLKKYLFRK